MLRALDARARLRAMTARIRASVAKIENLGIGLGTAPPARPTRDIRGLVAGVASAALDAAAFCSGSAAVLRSGSAAALRSTYARRVGFLPVVVAELSANASERLRQ